MHVNVHLASGAFERFSPSFGDAQHLLSLMQCFLRLHSFLSLFLVWLTFARLSLGKRRLSLVFWSFGCLLPTLAVLWVIEPADPCRTA